MQIWTQFYYVVIFKVKIGGYVAEILLIVHKTQNNQSFKVKQRNNSHPSFHNAYVILALK